MPHGALYAIESAGDALRRNVAAHIAAYDRPGHYLRVSLLFDRIFWRAELAGAWFMLDAFGGCCVYDESARHGEEAGGVLGWLIAGANALMLCNTDDETLAELALNTSPRTAPAIATIRLSAKSKRASRPREPPSAILTVSSRRLARARATSRLAMFVQATSRRSATAAIIAINGRSKAERSEDLPVPASVRVKGRVR